MTVLTRVTISCRPSIVAEEQEVPRRPFVCVGGVGFGFETLELVDSVTDWAEKDSGYSVAAGITPDASPPQNGNASDSQSPGTRKSIPTGPWMHALFDFPKESVETKDSPPPAVP